MFLNHCVNSSPEKKTHQTTLNKQELEFSFLCENSVLDETCARYISVAAAAAAVLARKTNCAKQNFCAPARSCAPQKPEPQTKVYEGKQ